MRKFFIVLLTAFFSVAISSAAPAKGSKVASDRLSAIEAANSWNDISAGFEQKTFVALIGKEVAKKGKLAIKKGGKLRIAYDGKGEKNYVSDGTTLWIFVPGNASSLQTYEMNDKNVPKEALSFLNGFGKLRKDFDVSDSQSFPDAKTGTTSLHLTPKARSPHFESLDVLFDQGGIISELVINNTSGNRSHYKFRELKLDTNPPDRTFTLDDGK